MNLSSPNKIVILGAGQAGVQTAISLRQAGFEGAVQLIGDEPYLPYQRPPLSKAYLTGDLPQSRMFFRAEPFYEEQKIDLLMGTRIAALDVAEQTLQTDVGDTLHYDQLLLATGAPARRLSLTHEHLDGIHYLRTLDNSDSLREIFSSEKPVVIIGAGYIGLEVAAVARAAGVDVIVVEMADRVLARVAGDALSSFYHEMHTAAGVDFRLNASMTGFTDDGSRVTGVVLDNDEVIDCGSVLVGIGAVPACDIAEAAGLEIDNGIVVDEYARTSQPNIWAAGDCSNFPSQRYQRRLRLESVPNAMEQAKIVAKNMIGGQEVYDALPWFWSNQYDLRLQTAGLLQGFDHYCVRGDVDEKKFSIWYFKDDQLLSVDAMNDPGTFVAARKMLEGTPSITPEQACDAAFELKSLL